MYPIRSNDAAAGPGIPVPGAVFPEIRLLAGIAGGRKVGPWREQPPETVLFVLLAVQFDKKGEDVHAGLCTIS